MRLGIVTSGKFCPDSTDLDNICRTVERLRAEKIIAPCASLGLLNEEQAQRLAAASLVRYHHNLEASLSFFPQVCTSHSYQARVDTVLCARQAGLEVCVGGIVGLGETPEKRLEFFEALAGLAPESVPLTFLNPITGTKLECVQPLSGLDGFMAASRTIVDCLINQARFFSLHHGPVAGRALVDEEPWRRDKLRQLGQRPHELLREQGLRVLSREGAIILVLVGEAQKSLAMGKALL